MLICIFLSWQTFRFTLLCRLMWCLRQVLDRDWRMTFLPAFKACVEAGTYSLMCSYNKYILPVHFLVFPFIENIEIGCLVYQFTEMLHLQTLL